MEKMSWHDMAYTAKPNITLTSILNIYVAVHLFKYNGMVHSQLSSLNITWKLNTFHKGLPYSCILEYKN